MFFEIMMCQKFTFLVRPCVLSGATRPKFLRNENQHLLRYEWDKKFVIINFIKLEYSVFVFHAFIIYLRRDYMKAFN